MLKRLALCIAAIFMAASAPAQTPKLQKIVINYPTRSSASWAMFIAKEGGYYQKYGFDVDLTFGAHPAGIAMLVSGEAAMTNYSMEQALQASSKDGSLIAYGSSLNKGLFAFMSKQGFNSVKDLKGKKIAVSQIGDAPYNYTIALLAKFGIGPRDVEWMPIGTDANGRAAALTSGRADATLLTAPTYFKIEEAGYKSLANLADYNDVYASSVYLFKKTTVAANPKLPELLIKAHAEAIKRFYDDKAFAVKAYLAYDKLEPAYVERVWDLYKKGDLFERVPYVLAGAVKSVLEQADSQAATQIKDYDFKTVIDNSIVERLVKEGYFEKLYGPGIKAEEDRKAKIAFK
jgi:ABC-type nitrate/sulfonate/bicarbonate transport system substrate-binding protein